MKTMFGGSLSSQYHPKMRMKRIRTCSSDSGCDMVCDSPDLTYTIMEDAVMTWEMRLEGVMKQEVARCREVTGWAKEALRHSAEGTVWCDRKLIWRAVAQPCCLYSLISV